MSDLTCLYANTLESILGIAVIKQIFINHLFTSLIIYLQVIPLKTQLEYSCVNFSLLHLSHFIFCAGRPSKCSYNLYFCINFAWAAPRNFMYCDTCNSKKLTLNRFVTFIESLAEQIALSECAIFLRVRHHAALVHHPTTFFKTTQLFWQFLHFEPHF